jgi:hypothetical protein
MNRRRYWWHFHTAPDDWIYHRAIEHLLPVVEFMEADYREHGGGDVVKALRSFAAARELSRRRAFVLVTEGLWGGYYHVEAAREFIRSTLYQSRYAASNLLRLRERIDAGKLLVGMHVRLGDFQPSGDPQSYVASANKALPIDWFCSVARTLDDALGAGWQLLLVSDGTEEQLRPLVSRWPCIITADLAPGDCSDVLALAAADLLVCSASTYSTLAAFLSESPYLWFRPNLYVHPEGCFSIGDFARNRELAGHPTRAAVEQFSSAGFDGLPRGAAVDIDGQIPPAVIDAAMARLRARRAASDLSRNGITWPTGAATDRQSMRA